ncbi:hypothetical protein Rhopal_003095-T1 [Rhodotorula paludigena]|uniref:Uncharacterized protein n=1 Tax=Rhodotorula paludigena TaxID=86838 RepID=A0AAV5GC95_9BASI|nr:hypothetical protein Rhopal_003095-T1 [Rhodotorula paludigena]
MQRLARHPLCTCSRAYSVASKARKQHKPPAASSPSSPRTRPQPPSAPHTSAWAPPSRPANARTAKPEPYREPPLVERARRKTVQERSVLESYLVLSWKTRLYLWLGLGAFALVGLYGGDYLFPETEEEKVAKGEKAAAPGGTVEKRV